MSDLLLKTTQSLQTLEQIITWGMQQTPPVMIAEMHQQDEFTLDVIVAINEKYLVYDVT